MKLVLISLAVLAAVLADGAPYQPQGALLVFPQQQFQQSQPQKSLGEVNEQLTERLRQEQGSQSGNYHVYLSDGRLQRVQYTAVPLSEQYRRPADQQQQQVSVQNSQTVSNANVFQFNQQNAQTNSGKYVSGEPNPVVAHFGRLQQEILQQQLEQLKHQQEQLKQQEKEVEKQLQQQKAFASNYVATIQFSDVPPVPAPIYSQSPAPLTRILRHLHY